MAIDTKLNIDTSIKSRSDTITPNVRQDGGQMDRFMTLADALQDFNPALKEFAISKTKEKGWRIASRKEETDIWDGAKGNAKK